MADSQSWDRFERLSIRKSSTFLGIDISKMKQKLFFSGRVFFDHLPKTAGTSVTKWLYDNLGDGTVTPISSVNGPHLELISKLGGIYPIISGHTQFICGDDLDPRWVYITLLREPIDRCLSWMYYLLNDVNEDSTNKGQIEGARIFLESNGRQSTPEFIDGISNIYVKHFSSINSSEVIDDSVIVSRAIKNILRYDLVGFSEDLESFRKKFCAIIGLKSSLAIPRINVTTSRQSAESVGGDIRLSILKYNQLDVEFYNQIRKINQSMRVRDGLGALATHFGGRIFHKHIQANICKDYISTVNINSSISDIRGGVVLKDELSTMLASEEKILTVEIFNDGDQNWGGDFFYPINFSYHWKDENGQFIIYDGERTSISVGSKVNKLVPVKVIAPSQRGRYKLILTLVQERRFWFEEVIGGQFHHSIIEVLVGL